MSIRIGLASTAPTNGDPLDCLYSWLHWQHRPCWQIHPVPDALCLHEAEERWCSACRAWMRAQWSADQARLRVAAVVELWDGWQWTWEEVLPALRWLLLNSNLDEQDIDGVLIALDEL